MRKLKGNVGKEVKNSTGKRTKKPSVHIGMPVKEMKNQSRNNKQGNVRKGLPLFDIIFSFYVFCKFHFAKVHLFFEMQKIVIKF
jgi:hypothetical protein